MTVLAIDALGLPFVLACIVVWCGFVLLIARAMGINERHARRQREQMADKLELEIPAVDIADFMAEAERRAERARFRHHTRFGRSA